MPKGFCRVSLNTYFMTVDLEGKGQLTRVSATGTWLHRNTEISTRSGLELPRLHNNASTSSRTGRCPSSQSGLREICRRTRPMTCFTNIASYERIIFAIASATNKRWEGRLLWRESTQDS